MGQTDGSATSVRGREDWTQREETATALLVEPAAGEAPRPPPGMDMSGDDREMATAVGELVERRQKLLEREQSLELRMQTLAVVEGRVAAQLEQLEAYAAELEGLAKQLVARDKEDKLQLVRFYEAMKPKSAAEILDRLELAALLPIVRAMRETRFAAIAAHMSPERVRTITSALAAPASPPSFPPTPEAARVQPRSRRRRPGMPNRRQDRRDRQAGTRSWAIRHHKGGR
ncbi:MotE family protein [Marinimicrococcus flavescens]|uniref:Magnesium transporter MgtE intracellular domain-containing protein n=1 Tax=Marinimicrococcus flavescens TaxID=3031815 RepID=A0AAP3UYD8_9PROT|nr:hypothetical protein [Marinimicrococcus flavescens]